MTVAEAQREERGALMGGFMGQLALSLPVVAGATPYRLDWFFPAFIIVLSARCLPFSTGAWFAAVVLVVFAIRGMIRSARESDA